MLNRKKNKLDNVANIIGTLKKIDTELKDNPLIHPIKNINTKE